MSPEDFFNTNCPKCGQSIECPNELFQNDVECPTCKNVFKADLVQPPPLIPQSKPTFNPRLKPCKHCGHHVSKSAKTCPNCGGSVKQQTGMLAGCFVVCVICFVGCFGLSMLSDPKRLPASTSSGKSDYAVDVGTFTFEENEYGHGYVTGTIKSKMNHVRKYLTVTFSVYDSSGARIGSASDTISNLEPYGTWKYKAAVFDKSAKRVRMESVTCEHGRLY